jgi:hypothetical protein
MVYRARLHDRWIRRAVPLLVVVACEGASPSSISLENTAAMGGTAGTAGNGASAAAGSACESVYEEDYRRLESCNFGNGCSMRRVRGYGESPYYWASGPRCLFSGLRDRTPGKYTMHTEYSDSCQWDNEVMVVDSDGNVFVSSAHYYGQGGLFCPSVACVNYGTTRRCTLKSPDFYDDCLALSTDASAGGGAGGAPDEDWNLPPECYAWYTDCGQAEPICPAE